MEKHSKPAFKLSNWVLTSTDLSRTIRDIKQLDEYFHQAKLRGKGQSSAIPKVSRAVEELAQDNKLSILEAKDRQLLLKQLEIIDEHAPMVHFSFPSEPSRSSLETIVGWLRANINHYSLVRIGLEPTIGIGCVVRTENKIFDCSLKNRLKEKKVLLKQGIEKVSKQ